MILVTGAGGLIGSALVQRLRTDGFEVWAPSREKGVSDTLDLNHVSHAELPAGLQAAFLCAWHGGVAESASDPQGARRTNVEGTLELVGRLSEAATNVVFLSTSLVFSGSNTSAHAPLSPCCVYGEQKAAVEAGLDAGMMRLSG